MLSSQNLKRVLFSTLVTTRKVSHFENRFLTWVPTLTPSDPPPGVALIVDISRVQITTPVSHKDIPSFNVSDVRIKYSYVIRHRGWTFPRPHQKLLKMICYNVFYFQMVLQINNTTIYV
jgi:hypothetical protein